MKSATSSRRAPDSVPNAVPHSRLSNLLLMLGPFFFLISVFFEWRHTQASSPQGTINLSVTAWETGLLGGQGLFLIAVAFLIAFPLLCRRMSSRSPLLLSLPFLVLFGLLLGLTLQQVLNMYAGRSDLTHLHTYLGIGFYLAMFGGDCLILALILSFRRARESRGRFS